MNATRPDLSNELLNRLTQIFEFFGKDVYGNPNRTGSPLISHLCLVAASDPEIMMLVAEADFATQITNLLFGAVQYLLLGGIQHPLRDYYPSLTDNPQPVEESYPHFRTFCLEHADEIRTLV